VEAVPVDELKSQEHSQLDQVWRLEGQVVVALVTVLQILLITLEVLVQLQELQEALEILRLVPTRQRALVAAAVAHSAQAAPALLDQYH
jgi:hypothetical protein